MLSFFKKIRSNRRSNKLANSLPTESEFVLNRKENRIGLKSSLIEYACLSRNLEVERLSRRIITIQTSDGRKHGFVHMNGANSSRLGNILCDRKQDTRYLLQQNNIMVADSKVFGYNQYKSAVKYVEKLDFPVVVKPTLLSRGRGITTNIQTFTELENAWDKGFNAYRNRRKSRQLIIERHFPGDDYRFFVVGSKVVSVTQRKRANVVGDGSSTILKLIHKKNIDRGKNPYLSNYLIPTNIDDLDLLRRQNIDLNYIPNINEEITLRSQSNLSAGGDSIDVTDIVHPEFKKVAINSVKAIPGIAYAGVDFIATTITEKPNENNHIVGEIEFSPAPLAHFPLIGKRRDMAGAIVDFYISQKK